MLLYVGTITSGANQSCLFKEQLSVACQGTALTAVSQGWDEGQRCLPLPGCTSTAQGQVRVPPKRNVAVRRHTRLQREEKGLETHVSPVSPASPIPPVRSESPALLPSQEAGAAYAAKKPRASPASSIVKRAWRAVWTQLMTEKNGKRSDCLLWGFSKMPRVEPGAVSPRAGFTVRTVSSRFAPEYSFKNKKNNLKTRERRNVLVAPPACLGSAIITHPQPGCVNKASQSLLLLKRIKTHISRFPGDRRLPWRGAGVGDPF